MLKELPPQFWKFFPLVVAGVFMVSGLGLIISGAVRYQKITDDDNVLGFVNAAIYTGSTLTISIGVTDFFTGLFGLGVALLNRKWLYMVYCGFLVLMLLGNMTTFYAVNVLRSQDYQNTVNELKKFVVTLYGNNSRTDGQVFTRLVDELQSNTPCCGFSGDETENIFLKTTWHQQINSNVENINLPDSCCEVHSDNCRGVTNMESGRSKGFVHKTDCMTELYTDMARELFFIFVEVALSTLLQMGSGVYTVLLLMYGPEIPKD